MTALNGSVGRHPASRNASSRAARMRSSSSAVSHHSASVSVSWVPVMATEMRG